MVLRAGLVRCGKSRLHWDSIYGPSSPYRVAIPTALSRPEKGENINFKLQRHDNINRTNTITLGNVWRHKIALSIVPYAACYYEEEIWGISWRDALKLKYWPGQGKLSHAVH